VALMEELGAERRTVRRPAVAGNGIGAGGNWE
jgi:hypothetical protein